MADAYTGVFSHIETHAASTLEADSTHLANAAARIYVKTFDDEPRDTTAEYADHELPAVSCFCVSGGRDDAAAIGGMHTASFDLTVYVIAEGGESSERFTLCKDIGARVIKVLSEQYGDNQMSDLDDAVPDADPGSVDTYFVSATFEEEGGRDSDYPYRILGELHFDVRIDLTR